MFFGFLVVMPMFLLRRSYSHERSLALHPSSFLCDHAMGQPSTSYQHSDHKVLLLLRSSYSEIRADRG